MKLIALPVLCGSLLLCPTLIHAGDFSMNIKGGSLGVGVEGEYSINEYLGARLGANYFKYSYDSVVDDIDYEFDLGLRTVSALVDVHPFKGSFRVSLGAMYNGNKLDADATPAASYKIGDHQYAGTDLVTLKGTVDFKKIAPYLGLGWDTCFGKDSGFGFYCDLGALFQGSPEAELSAVGPLANDPALQKDLALEKNKLQDDLDNYKVYPVVSLGVSYRF